MKSFQHYLIAILAVVIFGGCSYTSRTMEAYDTNPPSSFRVSPPPPIVIEETQAGLAGQNASTNRPPIRVHGYEAEASNAYEGFFETVGERQLNQRTAAALERDEGLAMHDLRQQALQQGSVIQPINGLDNTGVNPVLFENLSRRHRTYIYRHRDQNSWHSVEVSPNGSRVVYLQLGRHEIQVREDGRGLVSMGRDTNGRTIYSDYFTVWPHVAHTDTNGRGYSGWWWKR